ncbi:pyruvate dehydrogenase (acetyl-transferring) E1 component subunit alpha [Gulosibacter molinativorax]|uniref:Pyruvate dehydrogenase (Acetyl-transferring) E1 component subunit alpha n=1 Tax=Gulosibacter molinativorax TaxID=256821 RepID=A0ABT7CAV8_9MICO|nr:pyruvate dehydrogenase (acetyl-transferring) E1 component subunit alpha [Gulosibacter molinativorax]MDJ1372302.1 pyruvate dehydrogenase (acetyl-transferring) E1 component subunit alpha [Gulosibacter molinativorax]QUY63396.1 Pyruvate dehydrogenase E1 component subunit alpha [Gulosibacter molinativorax]
MRDNEVEPNAARDIAPRGPELSIPGSHYSRLLDLLPGAAPVQLIDEAGEAGENATGYAMPDDATLQNAYRRMVIARRWEAQVTALTRQGRLATYPSAYGQEAGEVGSVLSLEERDWMFPTYRESSALLTRGVPPRNLLSFFRGDWHNAYNPYEFRISAQSTPLATQSLHAVGFAHAEKLQGRDTVTLTYLGDGASSEGDTHEAMNFAATWNTATVFFVQNNQYAISTPLESQTRSRSIADRAAGLGIRGVWVDGNDIAAVIAVLQDAVARARAGEGPTVVEARTYRLESHTNSDDPTRYRTSEEAAAWAPYDPIERLATYLRSRDLLGEELEAEITAEAEANASKTRDAMNETVEIDPLELFEHVYATPRSALNEQRAMLAEELAAREPQGATS